MYETSTLMLFQKVVTCPLCYKPYRGRACFRNLRSHMSAAHGQEKPFKCKKCGKSFDWQRTMSAHKKECMGADKVMLDHPSSVMDELQQEAGTQIQELDKGCDADMLDFNL